MKIEFDNLVLIRDDVQRLRLQIQVAGINARTKSKDPIEHNIVGFPFAAFDKAVVAGKAVAVAR
jgi:hypothetical protein